MSLCGGYEVQKLLAYELIKRNLFAIASLDSLGRVTLLAPDVF